MKYVQLFFVIFHLKLSISLEVKPPALRRLDERCMKLAQRPYFDSDMVVGKPWRIYYTYNMKLENKCLDMVFKNATPRIVQRIWNDMYDYMEQQPVWDAAVLLGTMGAARHELLLCADQGAAGSFSGVPNVIRDGNLTPMKSSVSLLKFYMKLLNEGKFLVMIDCHMGVGSISARADRPPYRSEILAAAAQLNIGDGYPACTGDKNDDEQFLIK
ncbi:uncharacterized protein LOC113516549 [Galleria mellonella]|uniref:Uncharacterized protein LOC113516549 n=1 Tax=Galleria mellonella TaxID=7137 RepID=A0A6J3BVZ6_GALME|nr:uncharacterized protein LOC113516549 [Galleria mellonella]